MAGFNLVRNARAFFTTNLNASTKAVLGTGHTSGTTQEIQVLNGFTFSQNTETQNITVSEAGLDPARGQRTFNTALAPVEFSFSTYVRPTGSTTVDCEEKVLWNALLGTNAIDLTGTTITVTGFDRASATTDVVTIDTTDVDVAGFAVGDIITISGVTGAGAIEWNQPAKITAISGSAVEIKYAKAPAEAAGTEPATAPTSIKFHRGAVTQNAAAGGEGAYLLAHAAGSNKNQLQAFGMVITLDNITYVIDNCALNQASIEFGLDGIATVAWTGNGTTLRQLSETTAAGGTFSGGLTGNYQQKNTSAHFITNKLATVTLASNIRALGSSTAYTIAITGGNLTINNNINYVTPEILGVVNAPIGYFTGTRAVSGNLTAYLKTGTNSTATLLSDMLSASSTTTESKYAIEIAIGGHANPIKVEIDLPAVMLQIPTIETADVLSTTINFTAEGFDGTSSGSAGGTADYDLEAANDFSLRYYSA